MPDQNALRSKIRIMGILNLSPDSFYPASRMLSVDAAVKSAERLIEEGADILDVGAESSRPGSKRIAGSVEVEHLVPVVSQLVKRFSVPVSVDTCKASVARRVLEVGATMINDISGLQGQPEMAPLIAEYRAGVVVMHMRGTPETMNELTGYDDLIGEILEYLSKSLSIAAEAGIDPDQTIVDPGIGFAKTPEQNLELIARLDRFQTLGRPILLGVSRKSFIGKILDVPVEDRLEGSLAAAVIGVLKGAGVLRVHDVRATVRAVAVTRAIMDQETG